MVQLQQEIFEKFRVDVPVTDIFNKNLIDLAIIIDAFTHDSDFSNQKRVPNILLLSDNHRNPPIFMIHSLMGFATFYAKLLPSLKDAFTVYGITHPNYVTETVMQYESLEELAADYINKMKIIAPLGPYCIGGFSAGGIIALEVARQLQEGGEEIDFLLLLDPVYMHYGEKKDYFYHKIFMKKQIEKEFSDTVVQAEKRDLITKTSFNTVKLLESYKAKQLPETIRRAIYIKCHGSLIFMANQMNENLDWPYRGLFNGMEYFLKQKQSMHMEDIASSHFDLLRDDRIDNVNKMILKLSREDEDSSYFVGNDEHNMAIAIKKRAVYSIKRLSEESSFWGHGIEPSLLKSGSVLRMKDILQSRRQYSLDMQQVLATARLSCTPFFMNNAIKSLAISSRFYLGPAVISLTQKLLVLRFISRESSELTGAWVLDDASLSMLLFIAQKMHAPLLNYLNVALSRNNRKNIGEAFDAALWSGFSMIIPMIIYGCLAGEIGNAIGIENQVVKEWGSLAQMHMISILPSLANITIEAFYQITHQQKMSTLGALTEIIPVLLAILLFQHFNLLNGETLGLSLSIGSVSKTGFYLQDLYRKEHLQHYDIFRKIPLSLIQRYVKETWKSTSVPFFIFSNYLVLVCLVSSKNPALSLVGYAIGKSCFDVINLSTIVVSASSGELGGRFLQVDHFQNAMATGIMGLAVSIFLASNSSIVLSVINGKQLTQLFISTNQIPYFIQDEFFDSAIKFSRYYIGLSLINSLNIPSSLYLTQFVCFSGLQKNAFFINFLLANATLLTASLAFQADTETLMSILLCANGIATLLLLYQWLKISDFQCTQISNNKLGFIETIEETAEDKRGDVEMGIAILKTNPTIRASQNRYALLAAPGQSPGLMKANFEIEERNSTEATY